MPLIVFDIDGTLTDTTGVDDECFTRALHDVLSITGFDGDWAAYPHATDTGLARAITRERLGRDLDHGALHELRTHFVALLHQEALHRPDRFARVPGAAELLAHLQATPGTHAALATGAWSGSARVKLDAARLPVHALPIATSDDHEDRQVIIRTAIARALREAPSESTLDRARARFGDLVYVGDGVWDARAARALGMGFVGVRVRGDTARLQAQGARLLCRGFADLPATLALLADAPRGAWG